MNPRFHVASREISADRIELPGKPYVRFGDIEILVTWTGKLSEQDALA